MPVLHAAPHHEGSAGHGVADGAVIHQPARAATGGAQESVGSRTQQQSALGGLGDKLAAIAGRGRERLFGEDMFSGRKRRMGNIEMRRRNGEVKDEIDLGIGQQRVDAEPADTIFLCSKRCRIGRNVGASAQFHAGKERRVAQIGH